MDDINSGWFPGSVAAVVLSLVCGCGTVSTRTQGHGGPYRGVGFDLERVASAESWLDWSLMGSAGDWPFLLPSGLFWVVDTPLSFTADTLLLPVEALRPATAETARRESDHPPGGTDGAEGGAPPTQPETESTSQPGDPY